MTLDTIIYETIPASYNGTGATDTTSVTVDMVADRSLPEGLYLIKFVGGAYVSDVLTTSSTTTTYINLLKNTSLISYIHPTGLNRCEWDGTNFITPPSTISPYSFTFILTNSATKPIKLYYKHYRTSSHYYNTTGTFIFQKLRDLNAGEE